tara:strand:- start:44 stop:1057 length:1014 start_codon:yes stop_codon:yes gene_type:complete
MNKLLTERFQELAGIRPLYQIEEGTLSDLKAKIKPTLSKIFSTGKSKSKEVYNVVKGEFNQENADKALNVLNKTYKGIKSVADKATDDPEQLKAITQFIPSLKLTGIATAIGSVYTIISGMGWQDTGFLGLGKELVWGDPSTILSIGILLASIKLIIYALQAIAGTRKGVGAVKSMFKEDEDVMGDVEFNDIESIFEIEGAGGSDNINPGNTKDQDTKRKAYIKRFGDKPPGIMRESKTPTKQILKLVKEALSKRKTGIKPLYTLKEEDFPVGDSRHTDIRKDIEKEYEIKGGVRLIFNSHGVKKDDIKKYIKDKFGYQTIEINYISGKEVEIYINK